MKNGKKIGEDTVEVWTIENCPRIYSNLMKDGKKIGEETVKFWTIENPKKKLCKNIFELKLRRIDSL